MALKQQLDEIDGKLRLLNFTTKKTDDILKTNDEEVAIRQKGQITKIILAISDLKQLIEEKKFIEGDSEENVAAWGGINRGKYSFGRRESEAVKRVYLAP